VRIVERFQQKRISEGKFTIAERAIIAEVERRSTTSAPSKWLIDALTDQLGMNNQSGKPVNDKTAMSIAAVHACVRVISEALSTMPLKLVSTNNRQRVYDTTSPAASVIREPNPYQTGVQFRKQLIAVAVLKGNSYAYIFRDGSGNPINVLPIQGAEVQAVINNGSLYYKVSGERLSGIPEIISAYDMIHLKGLCIDNSFEAISPIKYHAQTLGIDLAAQGALAATFKTGSKKFLLTSEKGNWGVEQQTFTKKSLEKVLNNEENTVAVPSGVKMETLSLSPQEAGYIDAHKMTAEDVARMFGVPASMIGADSNANKSSVEQDYLNFIQQTLNPWAVNIEAELEKKLLPERDKGVKQFKHAFQSLLKADAQSRAEFYSKMLNVGAMTPNEIRMFEDMNPYEDGDVNVLNVNHIPTGQLTEWINAKIEAMNAQEAANNNPNGNN